MPRIIVSGGYKDHQKRTYIRVECASSSVTLAYVHRCFNSKLVSYKLKSNAL